MSSFHEVRFPENISYGATGGHAWNTSVVSFRTGKEQRNQNWALSRMKWDVAHGVRTQEELDQLIDFFMGRRGRAHGFRFKDQTAFRLSNETLQNSVTKGFVGDGTTTIFNVVKRFEITAGVPASSAVNTYIKRLFKLRGAAGDANEIVTEEVRLDGVPQGSGFTIDRNAGTVTFTAAPSNNVVPTYFGEYDIPCRFDVDEMAVNLEDFNAHNWTGIAVVEINPLMEP